MDAEPTGSFSMSFPGTGIQSRLTIEPIYTSFFFGFVASSAISEVDIGEVGDNGLGPFTMENPTFAQTPEPGTFIFAGAALLVFAITIGFRSQSNESSAVQAPAPPAPNCPDHSIEGIIMGFYAEVENLRE